MAIRTKLGRTLRTIVLAASIGLAVSSCSYANPQYHFNGEIGEEQIKFYEYFSLIGQGRNVLEVRKPDGRVITYKDKGNDFKVDSVCIHIIGDMPVVCYSKGSEVGDVILEEVQKQFGKYLEKITEKNSVEGKQKEGIDLLK
jgi:hypothetical protein